MTVCEQLQLAKEAAKSVSVAISQSRIERAFLGFTVALLSGHPKVKQELPDKGKQGNDRIHG